MKMNTFAGNTKEAVDEFPGREALGNRALSLIDPEEALVANIDEQRMSPDKLLVTRFLTFLGNRLFNMEKFKSLPIEEQQRLKKEFLGD